MKIHVIFGQRKCRFEGQFAPEALECADEWTMEDNPSYLAGKLAEHQKEDDWQSLTVIVIEIPVKAVLSRLFPKREAIKGEIQS